MAKAAWTRKEGKNLKVD